MLLGGGAHVSLASTASAEGAVTQVWLLFIEVMPSQNFIRFLPQSELRRDIAPDAGLLRYKSKGPT